MARIAHFRRLEAWKEAHRLTPMVYEVTRGLPQEKRYGLAPQMRQTAVSVPANIVEGFKRRGIREKVRFYNVAEGLIEELASFFILCQDLGYVERTDDLREQSETAGRVLNGLIRSTERRRAYFILPTS